MLSDTSWDDERCEELKRLHAIGMSCANIAAALNAKFGSNYTKNAVIGKSSRLELNRKKAPRTLPPRKTAAKPVFKTTVVRIALVANKSMKFIKQSRQEVKLRCVPVTPRNIPLLDLQDCDCRYPTSGDGAPFLFCGLPKVQMPDGMRQTSYCQQHYQLCEIPSEAKYRSAA